MSNLGIVSATTCHAGLLNLKSKNACYYLPRFLDGENVHMLEFEAEMSGFAEILRRLARR